MKKTLIVLLIVVLLLAVCLQQRALPAIAIAEERTVLILMYHGVLHDPTRTGKYVLSPEALESDLQYLLAHGYETVLMRDLIAFVRGAGDLPEKPVVLTFDDGYYNNLTYVLPLLERYDCRAVLSVVGSYAERYSSEPDPNPNYAYLSWEELNALRLSDRFELQNHSYGMHGENGRQGSARMRGESAADYRLAFESDALKLQDALDARAGTRPTTYAYPFGVVDLQSRELLEEIGFSASLTCIEKQNVLVAGDLSCLWGLGRYNRSGRVSTEDFFAKLFGASPSPKQ